MVPKNVEVASRLVEEHPKGDEPLAYVRQRQTGGIVETARPDMGKQVITGAS